MWIIRTIQYIVALGATALFAYMLGHFHSTIDPQPQAVPTIAVKAQMLEYQSPYETLTPMNRTETQRECLALNIYHEAKNQSVRGMRAVGLVTLNRVIDDRYPNTICGVVKDAYLNSQGMPIRHKCQFSWYCDGKSDKPYDKKSWEIAKTLANGIIDNYSDQYDFTDGALWYHADYVKPSWSSRFKVVAKIDDHIFYKE